MPRHIVSSSCGLTLNFPDDELYNEYKREEELLAVRTYAKIRERYGVWASNQSKFVSTPKELREWDSKHMENLLQQYKDRGLL